MHDGYSYVQGGRRHEGNLSLAYAPVPSRRLERAPMRALRADAACDTSDLHLFASDSTDVTPIPPIPEQKDWTLPLFGPSRSQ